MKTRTINIALTDGRTMKVDAEVQGQWGAHPLSPPRAMTAADGASIGKAWTVTHIPTGIRIPSRDLQRKEALDLLLALDENLYILPEDLVPATTPTGARTFLPVSAGRVLREILAKLGAGP